MPKVGKKASALRLAPTSDAQLATMKGRVRADAADRPGIYRMLSDDGEVVYVGKSKRVRSRLLSYFRCAYPEEKGARILRAATQIEWDYEPSEFAALLAELRQIKRLRPRFNVAMKRDAQHYSFIKLAGAAAPKLLVVRGARANSSCWSAKCIRTSCAQSRSPRTSLSSRTASPTRCAP